MTIHVGKKVALILMKSDEADATITGARARVPRRRGDRPRHLLAHRGRRRDPRLDGKVGQELGRPIELGQWLVVMSSFVGRAAPGPDYFRVTSKMLELEIGT